MTAIGIDFGTTNSVAAVYNPHESQTEVIRIGEPPAEWVAMGFDNVLPSVVALDSQRQMVFGWQAKQLVTDKKFNTIKRLFRDEETVTEGGEQFYVEELAAALFGHIKQRSLAEAIDPTAAVVTIPANSRGLARHRTKVCAGMGGIPPLALINEPTAAAMAYARRHDLDGQTILVFDFGGGTLDVTVLAVNDGMFFEQGSSGIARLGGIDFDRAIRRHIMDESPQSDTWTGMDKARLDLEIEKAKIRLSSSTTDETVIADPALGVFRLTRPQFNSLTQPLVERSGEAIRRTLSDLRMNPASIDQVLLVGGTSKVPAVRQFMTDLMDQEPATGVDPMTAVGEGAAIAAAIMTGELDDTDFFLSTEHAMGTIVADSATHSLRFSPVIHKNQKLPAKQTERFVPIVDFQESVRLTVLEGDPELPIGHPDNLVLAEIEIPLEPPRPAVEVSIDLTYAYDTDGILSVDVADGLSDEPLVETLKISSQGALGGRALVEIAGRVKANVEGAIPVGESAVPMSSLDERSAALVATARSKVIPFVEDDDATELRGIVAALESSSDDDRDRARSDLDSALQRFSYLL